MMNLDVEKEVKLKQKAKELRKKALDLAVEKKEGHLGGAFSAIELILALYDEILNPEDRFLLSKGHNCYPMYLKLRERGFNPTISGHPDIDCANGICCTSGSLGHGPPIAAGMAFAKKLKQEPGQVYVMVGDGECQEGTIWETSFLAAHHKLTNLTLIVDHNKIQGSEKIENVLSLGNLKQKFESFGWHVLEIDGHSFGEIIPCLQYRHETKPVAIIAHTIKGKGVSFMENNPQWHGGVPKEDQLNQAYVELQ